MHYPIYIFESGATKTDVLIYQNGAESRLKIDGFNPNRPDSNFQADLRQLNMPENALVYFYGSGVGDARSKELVKLLFKTKNIVVENDLLAAAHALLHSNEGIICISGTGANVGYYNGESLTSTRGGYGYLIDDIGGGMELGKLVISHWLSNDFSKETKAAIEKHFGISANSFITEFYQTKNLKILAGVCGILPNYLKADSKLEAVVQTYFNTFVERHILPMCQLKGIFKVSAVGSIAHYFKPQLTNALKTHSINLEKVIKQPIDRLLSFHLQKKSTD